MRLNAFLSNMPCFGRVNQLCFKKCMIFLNINIFILSTGMIHDDWVFAKNQKNFLDFFFILMLKASKASESTFF